MRVYENLEDASYYRKEETIRGLANRRRIWKVCRQLAPEYLKRIG